MTVDQWESIKRKDPRYAAVNMPGVAELLATKGRTPAIIPQSPRIELPMCEHLEGKGAGGCRYRICSAGHGGTTGVKPCESCGPERCLDWQPVNGMTRPKPRWVHQFGPGLIPSKHQTNCSLVRFNGRLLLAYRTGWAGSEIHIAEIGDDMTPGPSKTLDLRHPACVGGREDPRLFIHDNQLYLSFIGVKSHPGNRTVARQLFAKLDERFNIVRVWEPRYVKSPAWEKNWQPFSHDGRLFAVYSMSPWVVVELAGDDAIQVSELPGVPWSFGHARGGAAPVLHDGEWYSFFHGSDFSGRTSSPKRHDVYTVGVCTFEDRFPFRPLRITSEPVLWPTHAEKANGWHASVVFPCGAYYDAGRWVVSYGNQDRTCRAIAFDAADIGDRLQPIAG